MFLEARGPTSHVKKGRHKWECESDACGVGESSGKFSKIEIILYNKLKGDPHQKL